MIGERLELARKSAGLSLRELADAIGNQVSHQAIQKYETNQAMPGSGILRALARALGVTERYLLNPRQIELTGIQFRPGIAGNEKELGSLKARLLGAIEKYVDIESLIPSGEIEWKQPEGFPYPVLKADDVEIAASRLRQVWSLGNQPLPHLPEVLEERGIKVFSVRLGQGVLGILGSVQRGNQPALPFVAINHEESGERQRLGLAHELAHLVLDFEAFKDNIDSVCQRFARAFLMLHDVFVAAIGKARQQIPMGELFRLKSLFGVAVVQIVKRCEELGIIGSEEKKRLFNIFGGLGWNKLPFAEPDALRLQKPTRFERLCLRALAEDIISESRTAELLGISTRELGSYFDSVSGVPA